MASSCERKTPNMVDPLPDSCAFMAPPPMIARFSSTRLGNSGRTTSSKTLCIAFAAAPHSRLASANARRLAPPASAVKSFLIWPYAQVVEIPKGGLASRVQNGPAGQSCLSESPRPVPREVPPLIKNGASAPNRTAMRSNSSGFRFRPNRTLAPAKKAAASLLPPPSPAPTGIRLIRRARTPENFVPVWVSRRTSQARSTRLGPPPGIGIPLHSREKPLAAGSRRSSSSRATDCKIVSTSW